VGALGGVGVNSLAKLSEATHLLDEARTLDEITHLHSMAQAAEEYAKAERLGDEAERYAREIRVRAARRAGEVLLRMKVNGERRTEGGDQRSDLVVGKLPGLRDLGIEKGSAIRWQKMAHVPEDTFEQQVAQGWGETAIARGKRLHRKDPQGSASLSPRTKTNGYTRSQSLRGLQSTASQLQGLAEGLDGQLLGDWTRLYDDAEAQPWFDILAESLPVVSARIKRALRERGKHGNTVARIG